MNLSATATGHASTADGRFRRKAEVASIIFMTFARRSMPLEFAPVKRKAPTLGAGLSSPGLLGCLGSVLRQSADLL